MESTEAILIRLTRLSDTSLIVHWFSEDAGLVKTVAKGARQPKSPFAGKLDLFFSAEIAFARSRKSELHALREVVVSHWREGLRKSYAATMLAGYFCQLVEGAVEPEHPEPGIFDLLRRGLDHIERAGPSLKALRHFESELARVLGVSHERRNPEPALRESLAPFPAGREQLVEHLSRTDEDLGSSSRGSASY